MKYDIDELADNYVKSEELKTDDDANSDRDSHMIIKLAYYNKKSQVDEIRTCCESNNSIFIPIINNKFGILTEAPWNISYGTDSPNHERNFGIKAFIDIYNCVQIAENKNWRFFGRGAAPYIGELLDKKFFLNILFAVSSSEDADFILKVLTRSDNISDIDELDELKDGLKGGYIKRILNLSFRLNGQDFVIDKSGYIDISSNKDFFDENKDLIKQLIITGYSGDYGKYYL